MLIFIILFVSSKFTSQSMDLSSCYRGKGLQMNNNAIKLEDVVENTRKPRKDKTIFFHVTNCLKHGYIKLTSRQSCAIESAALNNPNLDVYVLFASPIFYPANITSKNILSILRYKNVFLRNNDLWKYTKNTPIEEWFKSNILFKSKYVLSHTSDMLRFLTMWLWGGIYMDFVVVVKASFEEIPLNFAGAETRNVVASGIIGFESSGSGHLMVNRILKSFVRHFRGDIWGYNGPMKMTDFVRGICRIRNTEYMSREKCKGFQVFPANTFYAVDFSRWEMFFDSKSLNETLIMTEHSLLVHVWNSWSYIRKVEKGSQTAYEVYAQQYCPKVYSASGDYF